MKTSMGLRELVKITEMRGGCVYKTKILRKIWVPICSGTEHEYEIAREAGGDQTCSISTSDPDFEGVCMTFPSIELKDGESFVEYDDPRIKG